MNTLQTILAIIETLIKFEPIAVQGVQDLKQFGVILWEKLQGTEITDDERSQMETAIDDLFSRLEQPLPPAQPGDPDYQET